MGGGLWGAAGLLDGTPGTDGTPAGGVVPV